MSDFNEAVVRGAAVMVHEENQINTTDSLTLHLELLRVLHEKCNAAMEFRSFLMRELYLVLDPEVMSRRTGAVLVRNYCSLFEKLGGLRGTGDDKVLEQDVRARLLRDLYLPEASCQSSALKCLAVARSPEIKKNRDSLLRLTNDSSFRDELANLTSEMRALDNSPSNVLEDGSFEDVLVRICFGKMILFNDLMMRIQG